MLDPARGDDQAVHSGGVEYEAQGGARHRLASRLGRSPQLLALPEGLFVWVGGAMAGRMSRAAPGRGCLAEPIFAGEQPAGERAEGGIMQAVISAVWDQCLGIRGGE